MSGVNDPHRQLDMDDYEYTDVKNLNEWAIWALKEIARQKRMAMCLSLVAMWFAENEPGTPVPD